MTVSFPSRRWMGLLFLGISLGMLALGLTVFESQLQGMHFIYYWLICLSFTLLAALAGLWDLKHVRRQSVEAERELIHETIEQIESDKEKLQGRKIKS
jgi:hypothetical protein